MGRSMKYKDLKNCPFCGSRPTVGSLGGDVENWSIFCSNCKIPCVENDTNETLDDIKDQWNRRHKGGPNMLNVCKKCGSFAINENSHGRKKGVDLHLCDVCYWRERAGGFMEVDCKTPTFFTHI